MENGMRKLLFLRAFVVGFLIGAVVVLFSYIVVNFYRKSVFVSEAFHAISFDPRLNYPETRKKVRKAFVVIEDSGTPKTPEEKFITAVQYYKEGEIDKATSLLYDITKYYPNFCDAYAYLGYILCYEGEDDDNLVVRLFEKAIKCNPEKSLFYTWLGSYYKNRISPENEKEYKEKARECYEKALNLNPDDVSAWNNYGNLLVDLKNYDEAEKIYKKAIEIFPNIGIPQYNLATLMALKGDKDSALKWLKEALKYKPELRKEAKEDNDFSILRDDPRFQELIYNRVKEEIDTTLSED